LKAALIAYKKALSEDIQEGLFLLDFIGNKFAPRRHGEILVVHGEKSPKLLFFLLRDLCVSVVQLFMFG